ncbi:type II secretion system F family protein [Thermosediminibacter litoriperuensis]|uniref:Tight adherence protein C n=1 Tax=Thermosediminibacter litoriperuensis TaxID=291989 RepID=A0A5S5ASI1_9FIRM|nr:type II secretion system F family protein [Thermosediminibacter litoriperuensis]TYP53775.1 tight adherence protein C [Thermosediminibacter litoriperuensis]
MELYLISAGVSGLTFITAHYLLKSLVERRAAEKKRLTEVVGSGHPRPIRELELSAPLFQRFFKPILKSVAGIIVRFIPAFGEEAMAQKLVEAGRPYGFSPREFMAVKCLLAGFSGFALYTASGLLVLPLVQHVAVTAAGALMGWLLPDMLVSSIIRNRKEQVERELPDVLDLITVCVEAGLGFEGAMMKVVEKSGGILAGELSRVLTEVRMGKPRREALREMADRLAVDDLSCFVGSVIMAEQLGISMGNVLRLQSREIREKRRQRVEETAMKAPVKMLVPIVAFIFPALFVILLGPAAIQIMRVFGR